MSSCTRKKCGLENLIYFQYRKPRNDPKTLFLLLSYWFSYFRLVHGAFPQVAPLHRAYRPRCAHSRVGVVATSRMTSSVNVGLLLPRRRKTSSSASLATNLVCIHLRVRTAQAAALLAFLVRAFSRPRQASTSWCFRTPVAKVNHGVVAGVYRGGWYGAQIRGAGKTLLVRTAPRFEARGEPSSSVREDDGTGEQLGAEAGAAGLGRDSGGSAADTHQDDSGSVPPYPPSKPQPPHARCWICATKVSEKISWCHPGDNLVYLSFARANLYPDCSGGSCFCHSSIQ